MEFDGPTRSIVEFVRGVEFGALSAECVRAVVRNYLDSVGCAAAGFEGESAVIARKIAETTNGTPAASAFGLKHRPLAENAILANSIATRYQDWNDSGLYACHPSDMSPALVAMAEAHNASPSDLICATYIAYETVKAIGDAVNLRDCGWDQGFFDSLGVIAGLGKLLRLTDEQLANAIAISLAPSIPLRVARTGQLSHWKSAAPAHATMTATFAARLAQAGMTGPPHIFDGIEGIFEKVTGPFELGNIGVPVGTPSVPERVYIKYFPSHYNSQGPIEMMLKMRGQFDLDEIESITLTTFYLAWHEGGGGQGDTEQKRDPHTRETADHSLFYVMARALVSGRITPDSYAPELVNDPDLRPLMQKIFIQQDDAYSEKFKATNTVPTSVEVVLKNGRRLRDDSTYPRGHPGNPMSDDEMNEKFTGSVEKVLPSSSCTELRERLWNLPNETDLDGITALFRDFRSQSLA